MPIGLILATLHHMTVQVNLPEDLVAQIDAVAEDRSAFIAEAVRQLLRVPSDGSADDEIRRINEFADELNQEAEDVLEYQVIA